MIQYGSLKKAILEKLHRELPKQYTYHSPAHIKDVLNASIAIGRLEKITGKELTLLKTAALFHDSGFIFGPENHEKKSCEIARDFLPEYGFTANDIDQICSMIMATKIPQNPTGHLEEILADADLDYLGRTDFFEISQLLYHEFLNAGIVKNEEAWNRLQVKFFESHHYFTETSKKLRQKGKEQNLLKIKEKL